MIYIHSSALKNWLRKTAGDSRTYISLLHRIRSLRVFYFNSLNHLSRYTALNDKIKSFIHL
jgi:hypothetical protein